MLFVARRVFEFIGAVALALIGPPPQVTLSITPETSLMDSVLRIEVVGVKPGGKATIRATMNDTRSRVWESFAVFESDKDGCVAVGWQAPVEGSYTSDDPMGLIRSMQLSKDVAADDRQPSQFLFDLTKPVTIRFALEIEGKTVDTAEAKRTFFSENITIREVKEDGLVGELCLPTGAGPHPVVLVLTGSNGGVDRGTARLLASHGFAGFALAYFRGEGLPNELVEIPLDYIEKGLDWVKKQNELDAKRLAVMGNSRGGELSLLLGSRFPDRFRAVVAYVPSHVVWQGLAANGPPLDKTSWTYRGEPLPYVRGAPTPAFFAQFSAGGPLKLVDLFVAGLENQEAVAAAAIPVEKINGPVLVISGGKDEMWPSTRMADAVIERLKSHQHPHRFEHLRYPDAGHSIGKVCLPAVGSVSTAQLAFGGSPEANGKAAADSWPKVLEFLKQALK